MTDQHPHLKPTSTSTEVDHRHRLGDEHPAPPAPAGIPYQRITQHIPWQRSLLALAAVLTSTIIAPIPITLLATHLPPDGLPILAGHTRLALSFAAIASILPATLLITRTVERRPPGTLSSVTGRLRRRWLTLCLLTAIPTTALTLCAAALAGHLHHTPTTPDNPPTPPPATETSIGIGIGSYLATLTILRRHRTALAAPHEQRQATPGHSRP
ncbi:hypothetical protein [Micromonospora matsumotoense]|uniref:hypothetical protein n=1 Tax=Micromonospora matsumotoense TaxID=121616 RepID=UPI00340331A8